MKVRMPMDLEFEMTESKVEMLIFAKKSINSVLIYQSSWCSQNQGSFSEYKN